TSTSGRRFSVMAFLAQSSAVPAKAGTHPSTSPSRDECIPTFAGNAVSNLASRDGKEFRFEATASADEQQRRLFEIVFDALYERRRLPAIDDAMVEGGGQVHHLANHDLPVTHRGALGD